MLLAFVITVCAFAIIMTAMAVGVIFQDKCLRGSCGGPGIWGPDGEDLRCSGCPNRDEDTGECKNKEREAA